MKAAKITVLLIIIIVLMDWSRGDLDHKLPMVLPLLHGGKRSIFDAAGILAIVIGIAGLMRLSRNRRKDSDQD
ncbi:MAG: hypothetical protein E4H27_04105 [Anaerolineales bacterium]|nr:MAG: hypothetical protein E4H27_04105 [Anaerolineales bacterium]